MKYILLVGDGMADYPVEDLGKRTPLEAAKTPNMDFLVTKGALGRVKTIPSGLSPASDVANMSILGYDPKKFYSGRGPLEAANLGVTLSCDDVAFRCNLITAQGDILADYSAGHIKSKEAAQLINYLNDKLGSDRICFYPGVGYRHLMVVKEGAKDHLEAIQCKPPHDITGQSIKKNLPKGKGSEFLISLMQESTPILESHEINHVRLDLKENPANMIWLWGQGRKPSMPLFKDKYGVDGSVISAVDLLNGLGKILGLDVIKVPGATGYYDTDYEGKAKAALKSLKNKDFVFVHVEAPDEAGHNGDLREKILAIERFDQMVVGTILQEYATRDDVRILVLPDHATPVSVKTHTSEPVCFALYGNNVAHNGFQTYCEKEAENSKLYFENGFELMEFFMRSAV